MHLCYFAFFDKPDAPEARASTGELDRLRTCLAGIPDLAKAHIYTPAEASDIYNDDGPAPFLGVQLFFETIESLEATVGPQGRLKRLAESGDLPSLSGARATQQAMANRQFPVPENRPATPQACSYVVHYPGPAEDLNAWLSFYVENHPRLMARFPGIRDIEILTRIDWIDAMPWERVHHIQRNRILFDSAEALTEALHSPVRHEMRADFAKFPPYSGGNFHYPMATEVVKPQQADYNREGL